MRKLVGLAQLLHMQSIQLPMYVMPTLQVTLFKGLLEIFIGRKAISKGNYFSHADMSLLVDFLCKELSV